MQSDSFHRTHPRLGLLSLSRGPGQARPLREDQHPPPGNLRLRRLAMSGPLDSFQSPPPRKVRNSGVEGEGSYSKSPHKDLVALGPLAKSAVERGNFCGFSGHFGSTLTFCGVSGNSLDFPKSESLKVQPNSSHEGASENF